MTSDVLSEVLRAVRLTGAVYFKVECRAPWVAEAPAAGSIASQVLPGAEHVIEFHVVTQGTCWGGVVGEPALALQAGDVIVFPQGDAHVISSEPGMRGPVTLEHYRRPEQGRLPVRLYLHDSGAVDTQLVCGFIGCDARPFNPLLQTLPRVLHIPHQPEQEGALLPQLIAAAVSETSAARAGGEVMLARLSELLFIEAVRRHCLQLPGETRGWLAGLRDETVGRALSLLHARPAESWSLAQLAREVGSSRSSLAERFHGFVGTPPMQYLARWRMQLVAAWLSGSQLPLAEISERVGYGSEAALSRAFKRLVGVAPSAWREGARPDGAFVAPDDLADDAKLD